MLLDEYFLDGQFERILFYLKQNGYKFVEDLSDFNYDKLYFVPNILESERESFIKKCHAYEIINATTTNDSGRYKSNTQDYKLILEPIKALSESSNEITSKKENLNNVNNQQQNLTEALAEVEESWIYTYPVRMIERALNYKVKSAILNSNMDNQINTISDLLYFFPETLEGVRKEHLNRYFNDIVSIVSVYEKLSENKFLHEFGERTWEDYYNQLPTKILINNISANLLDSTLLSLLSNHKSTLTTREVNRLKSTSVRFFIENRECAIKSGLGKKTLKNLKEMIVSELFSTSSEATFISHNRFLSGESASVKESQLNKEIVINEDYKNVSVKQLRLFDQFSDLGEVLTNYNYQILLDIRAEELSLEEFLVLRNKLSVFKGPISDLLKKMISSLNENEREVLTYRGLGETLSSIGKLLELSRERVRQIEKKSLKKIQNQLSSIILHLLNGKTYFLATDMFSLFDEENDEDYYLLSHAMNKYDSVLSYVNPIERYYLKNSFNLEEINDFIQKYALEFGKIDELYDAFVESEFSTDDLNIDDFSSLLISFGKYKTNGDIYYLRKLKSNVFYGEIIRRYFSNGIKVTQDLEFNNDLSKLIEITRKLFPFVSPSSTARAFTALLYRNEKLILSGRGEITHISNTYIERSLLQEIRDYIHSSKMSSLLYKEVFEIFRGKLQILSSVTNYNYLHGILYYYFKTEFDFKQRDQITKLGKEIEPIDIKVQKLLEVSGPMHVNEIMSSIPGIAQYQVQFVDERNPNIFSIDYGMYASVNSLKRKDEISKIGDVLTNMLSISNKGYVSAAQFFNEIKETIPEFIDENFLSERGLLNLAKNKFIKLARFRYPHIVDRKEYDEKRKLDTSQVLWYLFGEDGTVTEEQLKILSQEYQWSDISIYNLLTELDEEMYRVGIYSYSMNLQINDEKIEKIDINLSTFLNYEYRSIQSITDYSMFSEIGFEWNGYLVETFIKNYSKKFRIIEREYAQRHTLSSIYVQVDSNFYSYEEIVVFELKKAGIQSITEYELQKILLRNGLANVKVPNELRDGDKIAYSKRLELYELKE